MYAYIHRTVSYLKQACFGMPIFNSGHNILESIFFIAGTASNFLASPCSLGCQLVSPKKDTVESNVFY